MQGCITTLLMMPRSFFIRLTVILAIAGIIAGCGGSRKPGPDTIAKSPEELQQKSSEVISQLISYAASDKKALFDSVMLHQPEMTKALYAQEKFEPLWYREEKWLPRGSSMIDFIVNARLNGLFPEDYYADQLNTIIKRFKADSLGKNDRRNVSLWAQADILLTDAFVQSLKDIKIGRLPNDSVSLRKDSVLSDTFYIEQLNALKQSGSMESVIRAVEPEQPGYHQLKNAIKKFLDSATFREYTKVPSPGKSNPAFKAALQKRLYEEGFLATDSVTADSAQLSAAIKKFQQRKGINADGRAGEATVRMMNLNDRDKFVRIALSMDKYKLLPQKMPDKYIWVNLPSFHLQLYDGDSAKLVSKVICGKPLTRTPLLNSQVSELITYPQWVPPPSIIQKEILPAVKKNPGYLAKKGFSLVDSKGEEVDPYSVDWSKYSKSMPYRVVQGSGDDNALGIMKFMFPNKYSVYLHDTNQRYLFGQTYRSLSHGCVRVQEWEKLAYYLIRNDSLNGGSRGRADSVRNWLAKKQKRSIPLKNKMPVFIRYITCEGGTNGVEFYDDIYGEDKMLTQKYFKGKQ